MRKKDAAQGIDMTSGKPLHILLQFSAPLVAGNILQQVYNMVDSSVAGTFIGINALSAVSNGYMIVLMITTMFSGLSIGGTIIVAQFYGQKNQDGIRRTVNAIYFGISLLFVPLMILGYFAAEPLLRLFNVPAEILGDAVIYVQVIFLGLLGGMGYNVNAGILSGLGDSKTSLKYLVIACLINLGLDILFVAGFHMGVFGTALATVIAQFISWLLGVRYINRRYPYIKIGLPKLDVDLFLVKQALKIGIPSSISGVQYTVGMMLVQSLINSYDMNFIAGVNAGSKIEAFVFMPINSLATAMSTYAAQNVGAGRLDRVERGMRVGIGLNCVVCLGLAAICIPLGRPLMTALFQLPEDALQAGMAYLYRVMVPSFILGISYVLGGTLRGAGAVMVATLSGIVALWIVRVPVAYWMAAAWGRDNLFFSYLVGWLSGIAISGAYYLSGRWKSKHVLGTSCQSADEM